MLSSAVNSNLRNVDAKKEECINQLRIDYFLQKASFLRPSVLVDEVFAKLPEKLIPGIFLAALLAEYSAAQPRSRIWLHNFVNADLKDISPNICMSINFASSVKFVAGVAEHSRCSRA